MHMKWMAGTPSAGGLAQTVTTPVFFLKDESRSDLPFNTTLLVEDNFLLDTM